MTFHNILSSFVVSPTIVLELNKEDGILDVVGYLEAFVGFCKESISSDFLVSWHDLTRQENVRVFVFPVLQENTFLLEGLISMKSQKKIIGI